VANYNREWFEQCFVAVCDLVMRAQMLGNLTRIMAYSKDAHKQSKRQFSLFGGGEQVEMLVLDDVAVSVKDLFQLLQDERATGGRHFSLHPTDLALFIGILRTLSRKDKIDHVSNQ